MDESFTKFSTFNNRFSTMRVDNFSKISFTQVSHKTRLHFDHEKNEAAKRLIPFFHKFHTPYYYVY